MIRADAPCMAVEDVQPQLRRTWFGLGGYRRDDVEALQTELARTKDENSELTSDLRSVRLALGEAAGWSDRLPVGLGELASLAAGVLPGEDAPARLGAAVLVVGGEHLLAQVEVSLGDPSGEPEQDTSWNENGRPVRTVVRLGGCVVDCVWQPGVDAGVDTVQVIEELCLAVVCSLAGLVVSRMGRDVVTQLGDGRALARHEALQARLKHRSGLVNVCVDKSSMVGYQELYGRVAWAAFLADAAAMLDRLARAHGGQAYHPADFDFCLLVAGEDTEIVRDLAEQVLTGYEGLVFDVGVVS